MEPTELKRIEYAKREPTINGKAERTASGKIVVSATVEGANSPEQMGELLKLAVAQAHEASLQLVLEKAK